MGNFLNLEKTANIISQRVEQSGMKNRDLSSEEFAKLAEISGNTVRSHDHDDYFQQLEHYLPKELKIIMTMVKVPEKESMRIKVIGCHQNGPFGLISYPVLPRIRQRIFEWVDRRLGFIEENMDERKIWCDARIKRLWST